LLWTYNATGRVDISLLPLKKPPLAIKWDAANYAHMALAGSTRNTAVQTRANASDGASLTSGSSGPANSLSGYLMRWRHRHNNLCSPTLCRRACRQSSFLLLFVSVSLLLFLCKRSNVTLGRGIIKGEALTLDNLVRDSGVASTRNFACPGHPPAFPKEGFTVVWQWSQLRS
jgi:hypothetical protein